MAEAKKTTKKTAKRAAEGKTEEKYEGFTREEREAMKEHAKELKASSRGASRASKAAEEEAAVVQKIAEMEESDRKLGERLHALVKANAPGLAPKLWYGMPAYAKDGKIVCFFQCAQKFKTRYATFGFSDAAQLDDGAVWPVTYALTKLTAADEKRISALIKKAVG